MITLLFVLACLLAIVLYMKKRKLEKNGGKTFTYHLVKQSLDFLVPFCLVTLFFLALSYYIPSDTDSATVSQLIWMEGKLEYIKEKASIFKLGPAASLIFLSALFLFNLLGIPTVYTRHFFPIFKKYKKVFKKVYIILVLLCCFTFFGTQLGEPVARLRFRINQRSNEARKGYGDLREQVRAAISSEVVGSLYDEVFKALPLSYQDSLRTEEKRERHLIYLKTEYQNGDYYRFDPEDVNTVAALVKNDKPHSAGDSGPEAKGPKGSPPPDSPKDESSSGGSSKGSPSSPERVIKDFFEPTQTTTPPASQKPAPPELDPQEIIEASEAVKKYAGEYQTRVVNFFKTEAGNELLFQPPKMVTGKIKKYIFEELTQQYPILDLIIEIFTGSFDKELEMRIEKATYSVTDRIIQNPKQANSIITSEVVGIVKEKIGRIPRSIIEKAQKLGDAAMEKLKKILTIRTRLNGREEEAKKEESEWKTVADKMDMRDYSYMTQEELQGIADDVIKHLQCTSHLIRLQSAIWLAQYGESLSEEQVGRVKGLLKNNEMMYIIIKGESGYVDSVTQYEQAPIKYYAAQALSAMSSPYVSDSEKARAKIIGLDAGIERRKSTAPADVRVYKEGMT